MELDFGLSRRYFFRCVEYCKASETRNYFIFRRSFCCESWNSSVVVADRFWDPRNQCDGRDKYNLRVCLRRPTWSAESLLFRLRSRKEGIGKPPYSREAQLPNSVSKVFSLIWNYFLTQLPACYSVRNWNLSFESCPVKGISFVHWFGLLAFSRNSSWTCVANTFYAILPQPLKLYFCLRIFKW